MFKRFGKMRFGRRIGSGFGVIIIMAAVLGYIGWNGVGKMHSYMSEYAHWVEISAVISEEVNQNAMKIAASAETYTSSPHEANKVAFGKALEDTRQGFEKWSKLIAGIPQLEKVLLTLREDLSRVEGAFVSYQKVLESNKGIGLLEAEQGLKASINPLSATLENAMKNVIRPAKEEKIKDAAMLQRGVAILSMVVAAAVLVVGVLLSFLIVRAVTKPVNRAIGELFEGAAQVSLSASQLASASQHVAEGSSHQAASIEETSSSLEEMASMTKQNADHAAQADSLMKDSNRTVGQARDSMNDLTKSMAEISKASQETSKIIKTIDAIAFQTNLLALNAAVEAARAGEAGAGFAVVAGEVRNLALRAAEAAKNTAQLIEETVRNVKDGAQLVSKTNEAFAAVAAGVTRVGELVCEISAASGEQAQGIDQVNQAVAGMDKVVQEIAASAEESASASQQMNSQAERMKGMVSELRVLIQGTGQMESDFALRAKLSQEATTQEPGHRHQKTAMGRKKSGPKKIAHARAEVVTPEQILPMDEQEFKDF